MPRLGLYGTGTQFWPVPLQPSANVLTHRLMPGTCVPRLTLISNDSEEPLSQPPKNQSPAFSALNTYTSASFARGRFAAQISTSLGLFEHLSPSGPTSCPGQAGGASQPARRAS